MKKDQAAASARTGLVWIQLLSGNEGLSPKFLNLNQATCPRRGLGEGPSRSNAIFLVNLKNKARVDAAIVGEGYPASSS